MRAADFLEPNGSSLSIALSPVLVRLIGRYSCNRIAPRCLWLLTLAFVRAVGRVSCNRVALVALGFWMWSVGSADFSGTASTIANPDLFSAGCGPGDQPILLELHYPLLPLFFRPKQVRL